MSPIVQPNLSEAPLWRFPPTRRDYPFTAWRAWQTAFVDGKIALRSLAASTVWYQPVIKSDFPPVDPKVWDKAAMTAADKQQWKDTADHVIHTAGIWTVFSREDVIEVCHTYNADVFGEVHLWGRVAKHKLGYRAEWCMIRKLYLMKSRVVVIRRSLEQRYGCDVVKA